MEFVWVPGGCYEMGCGEWVEEYCREDEYPVHEVCVDEFWMGKYEVTERQWCTIMPQSDLCDEDSGDYPAANLSWNDAQQFIWRLQVKSLFVFHFRLPTEAEWEYACRSGGLSEIYSGSNIPEEVAWYYFNSNFEYHHVGSKTKFVNGLGLSDMSGNVSEWVYDIYANYDYENIQQEDYEYSDDQYRVIRGGNWKSTLIGIRCSGRHIGLPGRLIIYNGFRMISNTQYKAKSIAMLACYTSKKDAIYAIIQQYLCRFYTYKVVEPKCHGKIKNI